MTILNIFDLSDGENFRSKDRKQRKDRKEKGAYINIISDLSLNHPQEFRRFMRMNYDKFLDVRKKDLH